MPSFEHEFGGNNKPIRVLVDEIEGLDKDNRWKGKAKVLLRAGRALQSGFGFAMALRNGTNEDYASLVQGVRDTTGLSSSVTLVGQLGPDHHPRGENMMQYLPGKEIILHNKRNQNLINRDRESWGYLEMAYLCVISMACTADLVYRMQEKRREVYVNSWDTLGMLGSTPTVLSRHWLSGGQGSFMRDFIRMVVPGSEEDVGLDRRKGYLVSRKPGKRWQPERKLYKRKVGDIAHYIMLTLLCESEGVYKDMGLDMKVRVMVTRGVYSGSRGKGGKYYEFVPPEDPERNNTRTYVMEPGTTLVLPASCLFSLGGHFKLPFIMQVTTIQNEIPKEVGHWAAPAMHDYLLLDGGENEAEDEGTELFVKEPVVPQVEENRKDLYGEGIIGTVPSIITLRINRFRRRTFPPMEDNRRAEDVLRRMLRLLREAPKEDKINVFEGVPYGYGRTEQLYWDVVDIPFTELATWMDEAMPSMNQDVGLPAIPLQLKKIAACREAFQKNIITDGNDREGSSAVQD